MITQEDIDRFHQMKEDAPKKLIVIDTQQYFEIEIPDDIDPEEFINTNECRKICAERILDQTTDLNVDRIMTMDKNGEWIE